MVFGDSVSDAEFDALLSEHSLPPETQVVTAPDAAALLALGGVSTPAMGYDLQTMLAENREIRCRVYELAEQADRTSLPRFVPAPEGSGKTVLSEFPQVGGKRTEKAEGHL